MNYKISLCQVIVLILLLLLGTLFYNKKYFNFSEQLYTNNKFKPNYRIENRRQFYEDLVNEELAEEMIANPSYFTDDSPYDLEETVENLEKGIVNESEMLFDEDEGK